MTDDRLREIFWEQHYPGCLKVDITPRISLLRKLYRQAEGEPGEKLTDQEWEHIVIACRLADGVGRVRRSEEVKQEGWTSEALAAAVWQSTLRRDR